MKKTCSIEGCDREVRSRGWCNNHYSKWHRTGHPLGSEVLGRKPQPRATTEKRCRICGEVKTRENFYVSQKGTLSSYCKPCHNERTREDHRKARERRGVKARVPTPPVPCAFEGCVKRGVVRVEGYGEDKYCKSHYQQVRAGKQMHPLRPLGKSYINNEVRRCTGCEEVKSKDAFHTRSNGKSQQRCKVCMSFISRYGLLMREGRLDDALEHIQSMPEGLKEKYMSKYLDRIN